jgi:hypothetical protein
MLLHRVVSLTVWNTDFPMRVMWCGVIGDQLIGSYIVPQHLTADIYTNFLKDELPALVKNVPLQTRQQMYYRHDVAPPNFSQVIRQYLNDKFPKWWNSCSATHNWPPESLDLNPLDNLYGVTWKLWFMHTGWTWEIYSIKYSALQEMSITLQCIVRIQVLNVLLTMHHSISV